MNYVAKIISIGMIITISLNVFYTPEVNGVTQKQKAKKAYEKILNNKQKKEGDVWYALVDVDRNGVPEMINTNGYVVWNIYTYRKGKVKKASNSIYIGEGDVSYSKAKKQLMIYAGGTTNCYYIWAVRKGRVRNVGSFYAKKIWKNNKFTLRYLINGKKVSHKKFTKAMKKYTKVIKFKQWKS